LGTKKPKQRPRPNALASTRDTIALTLQRADEHYTSGDLHTAERLYRQVLEREPTHDKATFLLGMVEYQRNGHPAARELFERALALNAAAPLYWLFLGRTLQAQQQHAAALVHFKRARQLGPRCPSNSWASSSSHAVSWIKPPFTSHTPHSSIRNWPHR
jgi:tetratricopeptide (TPR) repeat protein